MSLATTNHVGQKILTGLTALGSGQATAYALVPGAIHEFTTVASSTGAILPVPPKGPPVRVEVTNAGASTLSIYPPSGGTVAGGGANAAYSLSAGNTALFYASSLSNYYLEGTTAGVSATTPGGSSGQLQYDNAGAFGGAANLSYGSAGQLSTAESAAPGSPSNNDRWADSTQHTEAYQLSGATIYRGGLLYQQVANVTITAAASTTVISTAGAVGTVVWPAGFLNVLGRTLEVEIEGYITSAASGTGNINLCVKFGSTVIATSPTGGVTASKTNLTFRARFKTTVKATGTSGKLDTGGILDCGTSSGSGVFAEAGIQNGSVNGTPAPGTQGAFDLTSAVTLGLEINLSTGVNTIVVTNVEVAVKG